MRLLLPLLAVLASAGQATPYTVLPDGQAGVSYAQLGQQWWLWALTAPAQQHPVQDVTGEFCGVNQPARVWFLAGSVENGAPIRRRCTVPVGRTIFFPLVNFECVGKTKDDCTASLRAAAAALSRASGLRVTLDGKALSGAARGQSATTHLNDYGVWLGTDGYWMALRFDQPGIHVLAFGGDMGGFRQNVGYTLTVR